jgi:tetratricopeptide (TPR) repeat protein
MPQDASLYSYLGKAYYANEDLDEAIQALESSLEIDPSAATSTLLGKILFEKGEYDRAIGAYQRSLEIQRRHPGSS